jgi:hypothetical protein
MNNQLQLVSFEQAKRLKEAGFDWDVHIAYFNNTPMSGAFMNRNVIPDHYSAPAVALALKWFRDVKGFDYSIIKGMIPFEYSYTLLNGLYGKFYIKGCEATENALLDKLLTLIEK